MLVVPFALIVIGGVLYTNYVQRQADQRWCDLVTHLDNAYQVQPPTTELGRQIARAMHQLRQDLDC